MRHRVQGHTVSVSLLSDSEDEHRPEEATSSPSVHVDLRLQQHEQPASVQQLRSQLLEQQQLREALQSRSVGQSWQACRLSRLAENVDLHVASSGESSESLSSVELQAEVYLHMCLHAELPSWRLSWARRRHSGWRCLLRWRC